MEDKNRNAKLWKCDDNFPAKWFARSAVHELACPQIVQEAIELPMRHNLIYFIMILADNTNTRSWKCKHQKGKDCPSQEKAKKLTQIQN